VRWFVSIILGIAVGLAWLAIWSYSLQVFGIAAFNRQAEDRAIRRERIKQMGRLRYILVFGVLGSGLAFGLGITTADLSEQPSRGWVFAIAKLVFSSVLFGCFYGATTWTESFRDPVPFPPNYSPPK
jgi:hypothetical protein